MGCWKLVGGGGVTPRGYPLIGIALAGLLSASVHAADSDAERGAYLVAAGGCGNCHTDRDKDGAALAGGLALETPFGTFYTPNITPDPETGIGQWTEAGLAQALRQGISPQGDHYYPAFPYTSYTGMSDQDVADMWAHLQTVTPVSQPNRPHLLPWYLEYRPLLWGWKLLNFDQLDPPPQAPTGPPETRGSYLVEHVAHCGECHTPRNRLGGLRRDLWLAGNKDGPEGDAVPNITPHREDGIGRWSTSDIEYYLEVGMDPGGDFVGGAMTEVVDHSTAMLSADDRAAIASYLKSIPALPSIEPAQ